MSNWDYYDLNCIGHCDVEKTLIECKVDINKKDLIERTALHAAIEMGKLIAQSHA